MLHIQTDAKIFLHGTPVDLRNGFEGLASIAVHSFDIDLSFEAYFIFLNKRRTRLKILHWNNSNLSIWYIKSRKGTFSPCTLANLPITEMELKEILIGQPPNYLKCL